MKEGKGLGGGGERKRLCVEIMLSNAKNVLFLQRGGHMQHSAKDGILKALIGVQAYLALWSSSGIICRQVQNILRSQQIICFIHNLSSTDVKCHL